MIQRRKLVWAIIASALVTIVSDIILITSDHHATTLWGSGMVGFWAVFAVCWFLIFVFSSKWIGRVAVQKREDFYSQESSPESNRE